MAGTLTITGLSATEPAGERKFGPITIQGTVVLGETYAAPLASGDNKFTIPTSAVAALIVPPLNGSAELKLRTSANEGDAGLPISTSNPVVYSFTTVAPATLIVHASTSVANPITVAFI